MPTLPQYNLIFWKQHYKKGKYSSVQFSDKSMNSGGYKNDRKNTWLKNTW